MHTADQVAPGKAVLDRGDGALANRRPDAPQEWFQADAMLVSGPQLDLRVWEGGGRRWRPPLGGDGSFFKTRLLLGIRERLARTGDLQAVLGADERAPAQMMGDRGAQLGADPGGGLPAGPVFVAGRPPRRRRAPPLPPARPARG